LPRANTLAYFATASVLQKVLKHWHKESML
jgi:hypothetical protein